MARVLVVEMKRKQFGKIIRSHKKKSIFDSTVENMKNVSSGPE